MREAPIQLVHRTHGRVRLHVPAIVGRPDEGRKLAALTADLTGVSRVQARVTTGSLVIFHLGEWESIQSQLEAAAGHPVVPSPEPFSGGPTAMQRTAVVVESLDQGTRRASGGRTDLSELAFLGLLVAGAIQVARGKMVGPAITLFSQALTLMGVRARG